MHTRRRQLALRAAATVSSLALVAGASGCYERVVSASGPNASQYEVYEPSESDTAIDRAFDDLFGTERKKRRAGGR